MERLAARPRSARIVYERLREDSRGQTICNDITSGEVKVELGVLEALYGIIPFVQAMAAVTASAFAPAEDLDFSRSILPAVRHQSS